MLQMYVLNVSAVSNVCYKCFIWMLYIYVAMAIHVCCKCMFQTFYLFQMYATSVLSRRSICFSGYTQMLQESIQNVLSVSNDIVYLDVSVATNIYVANICL
jgi:hypothetical protein